MNDDGAGAPPGGALADLIVCRLLTSKSGVAEPKLRADLTPLFRAPPDAVAFAGVVAALRACGQVAGGKALRLTDAGRARGLAYLKVGSLPERADWRTVQRDCLLPMVVGSAPRNAKQLAPLLLRRKYGLPSRASTPAAAVEAVVCRLLGHPDCATYRELAAAVVSREVGSAPPLSPGDVAEVGVRLLLEVDRLDMAPLRRAALAGAFDAGAPPAEPPAAPESVAESSLAEFAARVVAAAAACPTGRVGADKVFISHVWQRLSGDAPIRALGAGGFKARLVEAHRARLLALLRADLVQFADPADVRASETTYLTATFHLIRTQEAN